MADETVVYNILHDAVAIRALVGSRIFPIHAPSSPTAPFIVYSLVYASTTNSLATRPGLDQRLVQVDCYAETHGAMLDLRDKARAAMENNYNVFRGEVLQEREEETLLYRSSIEFSLWLQR